MERYIKYHLSMGMIGLSIILMAFDDFFPEGYSIGLLLMMIGGLGIVTVSGYNIRQGNDSKPESELWWLAASGAILVFLGAILVTID